MINICTADSLRSAYALSGLTFSLLSIRWGCYHMLGKQKMKCQIIYLTSWKWFTGCCYNAIYVNLSQVPDTWAIKICFSGVTDGCLKGIFGSGIYGFWGVGSHKPEEVVKANTGQNMHLIKPEFQNQEQGHLLLPFNTFLVWSKH